MLVKERKLGKKEEKMGSGKGEGQGGDIGME